MQNPCTPRYTCKGVTIRDTILYKRFQAFKPRTPINIAYAQTTPRKAPPQATGAHLFPELEESTVTKFLVNATLAP